MRIAIDLSSLAGSRVSGIGNYTGHLTAALQSRTDVEVRGVLPIARVLKRSFVPYHFPELKTEIWWGRLCESRYDLYHGPDFKLPPLRSLRRVVTIHDLAFLEPGMTSPDFARRSQQKVEYTLNRQAPDAIITVSEFVRSSVLAHYPQFSGKVFTVHHGADHLLRREGTVQTSNVGQSARGFGAPFFLFVGNLEKRKNLERLIQAFEEVARVVADVRLILVGAPGFGSAEIIQTCEQSPFSARIERKGYVSESELIALYQNALGFVYPSLHEGFGFPILEAMSFGLPVITSKGTGTGEVAGKASAFLVDPFEVESIHGALHRVIEADHAQRVQWRDAGRDRARDFTWSQCARRTLMVYRFALSS